MSIRLQIIGAVLLVALTVNIISFFYFFNQIDDQEHLRFNATIEENARLLKVVVAEPLYDGNLEQLNIIIDSFFNNSEIVHLSLKEYAGDIRLERNRSANNPANELFSSKVLITRGIVELGEINLTYTTALFEERIVAAQKRFLFFFVALVAGLAIVVYLLARNLTIPIVRLSHAAQTMANGDLSQQIIAAGSREIKTLGQSFNRMRDAIREKIDQLAESEEKYRSLFHDSVDAMLLSRGLEIIDCNAAAARLFGFRTREELIAQRYPDLSPEFQPDGSCSAEKAQRLEKESSSAGSNQFEWLHQRPNGETFLVQVSATVIPLGGDLVFHALLRDITAQKQAEEEKNKLEEQLLQAQKMETVGRLAGGVAHDFNNMLSVIIGSVSLLYKRLPPDESLKKLVAGIEKAANHSSEVTRQLLAFSRQQVIQPKQINLNRQIEEIRKPLDRMLGEVVELVVYQSEDLWPVHCDPTHLEQIILNLAINARDAMPDGGKLTIETSNMVFEEADIRHYPDIKPGQFVMLAVSDQGRGMDKETLSRVFEPFFTTKELGKGTGLGLATVYGIVKQARGFIKVYSEPGRGATFKVYLPSDPAAATLQPSPDKPTEHPGYAYILLVEDDDMVRNITKSMLEDIGHQVTDHKSPLTAIDDFKKTHTIDLVLTDVVMPELNGLQLAERLRQINPNVRILFMSGYTQNIVVNHGVLKEGVKLLHKPFSSTVLADKVSEVLSAAAG